MGFEFSGDELRRVFCQLRPLRLAMSDEGVRSPFAENPNKRLARFYLFFLIYRFSYRFCLRWTGIWSPVDRNLGGG